jgi:hypothetical protein
MSEFSLRAKMRSTCFAGIITANEKYFFKSRELNKSRHLFCHWAKLENYEIVEYIEKNVKSRKRLMLWYVHTLYEIYEFISKLGGGRLKRAFFSWALLNKNVQKETKFCISFDSQSVAEFYFHEVKIFRLNDFAKKRWMDAWVRQLMIRVTRLGGYSG